MNKKEKTWEDVKKEDFAQFEAHVIETLGLEETNRIRGLANEILHKKSGELVNSTTNREGTKMNKMVFSISRFNEEKRRLLPSIAKVLSVIKDGQELNFGPDGKIYTKTDDGRRFAVPLQAMLGAVLQEGASAKYVKFITHGSHPVYDEIVTTKKAEEPGSPAIVGEPKKVLVGFEETLCAFPNEDEAETFTREHGGMAYPLEKYVNLYA